MKGHFLPKRRFMFFISQSGEHDCAFTCLEILLAYYHHDKHYLFLKHEDRIYSYKELVSEGAKYGTTLLGIKIKNKNEIVECNNFPLSVVIEENEGSKHSIVVLKVKNKNVYVFDPVLGKRTLSLDYFLEIWTGFALIVKNNIKTECPHLPPELIKKKDRLFLIALQLLSGLSLFVGVFFIDKSVSIILPIIFLTGFTIVELFYRSYLIKVMKHMDDALGENVLDVQNQNYYAFYENVEKYRSTALIRLPEIIGGLLIALFTMLIILLNDVTNIVYVLFAFSFAIVESFILHPFLEKKKMDITLNERGIKEAKTNYEYIYFSKEARDRAYQMGNLKVAVTFLELAIFFLLGIFMMSLTDSVNLTYLLFFGVISFFLSKNFSRLFIYLGGRDESDDFLAKIINNLKEE